MDGLKRIIFFGVLAGVVALFGINPAGWAQTPPGHPPMGTGGAMSGPMRPSGHAGMFSPGFFQEELGLSADQIEKFNKLRNDYEKELIRRNADVKIAEIELWELVGKKEATADQIEKKVREVEGKKTDRRVYRFKQLATLKTILTPEQYEKFRTLSFTMFGPGRHSMGGGMGMMKGGMMGGGMKGHGGYGEGGYNHDDEDEDN